MRKTANRWTVLKVALVSMLALALSAVFSTPATADPADSTPVFTTASDGGASRIDGTGSRYNCPTGRVCVWNYDDARGRGASFEYTFYSWPSLRSSVAWISGKGDSTYNRGNSCNVQLYTNKNHSGNRTFLNRYDFISDTTYESEGSSWESNKWCV